MFTFIMVCLSAAGVEVTTSPPGHLPGCVPVYGGVLECLPAPPGHAPPCAQPFQTYCEQLEHYPVQHIRHLIDRWGYDHTTLIKDETTEEFSANRHISYNSLYQHQEPIFIPKPSHAYQHSPDNYNGGYQFPRQFNNNYFKDSYFPLKESTYFKNLNNGTFQVYGDGRPSFSGLQNPGFSALTSAQLHQDHAFNRQFREPFGQPGFNSGNGYVYGPPVPGTGVTAFDPNEWWMRYSRDYRQVTEVPVQQYQNARKSRSATKASKKPTKNQFSPKSNPFTNTDQPIRKRRQASSNAAALPRQTLCNTRTQYIMPKAALNAQGNWMYVVNVGEQDNRYTQLVKSETCISQQCSGLCNLPAGYNSICEQKYVQKRLVALQREGDRLYTDTFWFPSCCVCTIGTN